MLNFSFELVTFCITFYSLLCSVGYVHRECCSIISVCIHSHFLPRANICLIGILFSCLFYLYWLYYKNTTNITLRTLTNRQVYAYLSRASVLVEVSLKCFWIERNIIFWFLYFLSNAFCRYFLLNLSFSSIFLERRSCGSNEFTCKNGQCIDMNHVCYYDPDNLTRKGCADKSHLLNCSKLLDRIMTKHCFLFVFLYSKIFNWIQHDVSLLPLLPSGLRS